MPVSESDSPAIGQDEPEIDIIVSAGDWQEAESASLAAAQAAFRVVEKVSTPLTISLSDDAHLATLNEQFRGKQGPTNVLSFRFDPADGGEEYLGDIAVAFETVAREAVDEGVSLNERLAHMVVHGVLHLLGYDHQSDGEAAVMEALETKALASLGIANPYAQDEGN